MLVAAARSDREASERVAFAVAGTIMAARLRGRRVGLETIRKELVATGLPDIAGWQLTTGGIATAQRLARSYAESLIAEAQELRRMRESPRRISLLRGHRRIKNRLDTIGVTETSRAFSKEREAICRDLSRETGRTVWLEWRTESGACSRCVPYDGQVIDSLEGWPDYDPGDVHPRCQCTSHPVATP